MLDVRSHINIMNHVRSLMAAFKKENNMIKKYTATIELSFNVLDEKSEKVTIEHIEYKLDDYARDLADYQDATISITNFYPNYNKGAK